jgi:hypothetical protein
MPATPAAHERRTRATTHTVWFRSAADPGCRVFLYHNPLTFWAWVSVREESTAAECGVDLYPGHHADLKAKVLAAMRSDAFPLWVLADAVEESGLPNSDAVAAVLRVGDLELDDAR